MSEIKQLTESLNRVCTGDMHRLRRKLQQYKHNKKGNLERIAREIQASIIRKQWRETNLPEPDLDQSLPIFAAREEIASALLEHQVIVVCGETGSGKTTQLPLFCLAAGRGIDGVIGHTQPRRIAARTVARRIADELKTRIGQKVGYTIRHQDVSGEQTYIKLMTDGILLSEMQHDRYLNRYDTLIIDEAHERSLNIDFILGYLKQLLPKRPELKIIVTSATIDVERFSGHFNDAPIIEVSGKTYPVETLYRVPEESEDSETREFSILRAIEELSAFDMGDILVFLEGEGEIHETDRFLRKQNLHDTDILPLYSRLSSARQNRIFAPHKRRHVVLATNVAETSLTIPGIRYVIDTGMARISRYSARSKVQRLPIEKISRASAKQRQGRCGRTSDGICIRLYSEEDFLARPEFTQPEILRTNLSSVILQMKALGLGDISNYPFIEAPDEKLINDGISVLKEISALDSKGELTRIGRKLSRLPIEPRYARMLLAAHEYNCLQEVLIIVSALSIQDPRERPVDSTEKADKAHEGFMHEDSDFIWFINVWNFYHQQMQQLSQNKLKKLCQQNYLSYIRMREWLDVHRQLRHICTELKFTLNSEDASYQNIHCAILSGLPSHVAQLTDKYEYTGARNRKTYLFPASCLFKKKPAWIVAAELVETSRLYARHVAKIEPQWVIATARHLLKYHYFDASWEAKSGCVVAYETVSLYGLLLRGRRKINYGKINPVESRKLFIQHALVEGQFKTDADVIQTNMRLIETVRQLEVKTRRPDLLDEKRIHEFYQQRLPETVCDAHTFSQWYSHADKHLLHGLLLDRESILDSQTEQHVCKDYPDSMQVNNIKLPIAYRFDPGAADDGTNIDLPIELLNQVNERQLDYLVPGLLAEKIAHLLKSLPKPIRKQLVPVPETVKQCVQEVKNKDIALTKNLSAYLFRSRGIKVEDEDWKITDLPEHLQFNYRIFDKDEHQLAEGRDLNALRAQLATQVNDAFDYAVSDSLGSEAITSWDFGDLPVSETLNRNETSIIVYPALIEEDGKVYRHFFDNKDTAEYYFRSGLRALVKQVLAKEIKYMRRHLRSIDQLAILYSTIGCKDDLIESIVNRVIDETFFFEQMPIRKQERFLAVLDYGKNRLLLNSEEIVALINTILKSYQRTMSQLQHCNQPGLKYAFDDISEQLEYLVFNGFIEDVPIKRLQDYPRYLAAISKRLGKIDFASDKDRKNTFLLLEHWNRVKQLVDNAYETENFNELVMEYRWMMEELRISLFSQELKTRMPVSIKRMDKKWDSIQQIRV